MCLYFLLSLTLITYSKSSPFEEEDIIIFSLLGDHDMPAFRIFNSSNSIDIPLFKTFLIDFVLQFLQSLGMIQRLIIPFWLE